MALRVVLNKVRAGSLIESVMALAIISACLFIALGIYGQVFSKRTSARFYLTSQHIQRDYFLMQVTPDSVTSGLPQTEWVNAGLREFVVPQTDSTAFETRYYIWEP
ncbi:MULTISPECIES: hypothetical protein [unclassified Flavobacterium]|uniref:hypothetical protein n=1 Tax=unclassified Flavobacterium TaxID=196869 RepID=UPI001F145DC6|nr:MULTISPECIES: hypothetical protein [unclassified Flavobacterium]UMY66255.1 hypothetical protein MKO97_02425 [Flavobacterium sp. HJ-32-4]